MTFSPEERPPFRMDTMTYLLSLSIPPTPPPPTHTPNQDEWRLHEPPKKESGAP